MRGSGFVYLLLFLFLWPLYSAGQHTDFRQISNESGLSNSAVTSIFQDSKGILWLGTWDGLNRYNGGGIKVYKPGSDTSSISNNIIRDILEDIHGNLWIATENGLNLYHREQDKFRRFFYDSKPGITEENDIKIALNTNKDKLYCTVRGEGLFLYDKEHQSFFSSNHHLPDELKNGDVYSFGIDRQDNFWYISETFEIYKFTVSSHVAKQYKLPHVSRDIESGFIINNHDGEGIWLFSQQGRALYFNIANEVFKELPLPGLPFNFKVTTVSTSPKGSILFGTDHGNVIEYTQGALRPYSFGLTGKNNPVKGIKLWSLLEIGPNILFIGTDGKGVFQFFNNKKEFKTLQETLKSEIQLTHNIVRSIYEGESGNLWIGTRGEGLLLLPKDQKKRVITYSMENSRLTNNSIFAINADKLGNIWLGLDGEGIDMYEKSSGDFFHFPRDFINAPTLNFKYVYNIYVDNQGNIWLGTSGYGVIKLEVQKIGEGKYLLKNYRQFINKPGDNNSLSGNIVYAITNADGNNLWIGTRGGGLNQINISTNEIKQFLQDYQDVKLRSKDILCLHNDKNNTLWIGTSIGLNKLIIDEKGKPSIQYFTEKDGLPNNTVHGILEDSSGNLWISTNYGLSKFNKKDQTFKNYFVSDGLPGNEFSDGAYYKSKASGKLYFGGIEGLIFFDPEEIKNSEYIPNVIITDFKLFNKSVLPEDNFKVLDKTIEETKEITLKHDQNFFSFDFTAVNYINFDKSQYAYMLENFDMDWNYIGVRRTATYTNVPPGNYVFKVKGSNGDGVFSENFQPIKITILPPFWLTPLAYILYFIGLAVIAFVIITETRVRNKLYLEKVHKEKLKEINQNKIRFFTSIAHEFRTPLTLIMGLTENLIENFEGLKFTSIKSSIKVIHGNSLRLLKLITELMDFRRAETGNMELHLYKIEFISFLNNIVESFIMYAEQRHIQLNFLTDYSTIYVWIDREKIEKAFINLLSNAIKYSKKEGGVVNVIVEKSKDSVIVIVKDYGIGIPVAVMPHLFEGFYYSKSSGNNDYYHSSSGIGLALTKSLIDLHNGSITVESEPDLGSTFKICLPLNPKPKGHHNKSPLHDNSYDIINLYDKIKREFVVSNKAHQNPENDLIDRIGQKYTIAIVEDNLEVRKFIAEVLGGQFGYLFASNGQDGLELIKQHYPDLVISDILMPIMDGLTMCHIIKADITLCHIPVLLLTARSEIEHKIEGYDIGADAYIAKPFHPKHLISRVKNLLEQRERLQKAFRDDGEFRDMEVKLNAKDKEFFRKLLEYINDNLDSPELSSGELALFAGMSKSQLYRKIKALTNLSTSELIKNIRIKKAARLLKLGEKTVSEIIDEVGFNNRSYFYRSFKQMFNMSPNEYLKNKS